MKFTTKSKIFQEDLKNALTFINKANKIPTLSNVLIEAKEDKIILTATDLITEGIVILDNHIKIIEEGSILTNTNKLYEILKLTDKEEISLETEGTSLIYSDESSMYELYTLETDSFSKFNLEEEIFSSFTIPTKNLIKCFKETVFLSKFTALKPYFTGVNIKNIDKNQIRFTSTDNFRVAVSNVELKSEIDSDIDIIIPKTTIQQILKFIENSNQENIEILFSHKYISLKINNLTINSKLIDDKFPDVEPIIKEQYEKNLSIDKELFYKTLKKASILTFENYKTVVIDIEREQMILYSEDSSSGRSKNILPVKYEFEPINFSIKPSFFFDVENLIKSDIITLEFSDTNETIFIRDKNNKNFTYLVQAENLE